MKWPRNGIQLAGLFLLAGCGTGASDSPRKNEAAEPVQAAAPNPVNAPSADIIPGSNEARAAEIAWRAAKLKRTEQAYQTAKTIDALLAFDNPSQCAQGPALQHLIDSLGDWVNDAPEPGQLPPSEAMIGPVTFEKHEDGLTAHLAMAGTWQGIEVTGLDVTYWDGGDPPPFAIRLKAPKETVRTMLNGLGFNLPPNGKREILSPNGYDISLELTTEGDTTWFTCSMG